MSLLSMDYKIVQQSPLAYHFEISAPFSAFKALQLSHLPPTEPLNRLSRLSGNSHPRLRFRHCLIEVQRNKFFFGLFFLRKQPLQS